MRLEREGRWFRRAGKIVGGSFLVLLGLAMIVLPGPGLLVLGTGLAVLATESPWLQRRLLAGYRRLPRVVRARTPRRIIGILDPANTLPNEGVSGAFGQV